MAKRRGKLYMTPVPLGDTEVHTLPKYVQDIIIDCKYFIVEKIRTTRRHLKKIDRNIVIEDLTFYELNKRTNDYEIAKFIDPIFKGKNVCIVSEAGCPGIADPGAKVVEVAHNRGVEVVPLVGPSSIMLALMGSGLSGQNFAFNGYLSSSKEQLKKDLKRLETVVFNKKQTQLFMETPYRNNGVFTTCLETLSPKLQFGYATDITYKTEEIKTKSIADWKKENPPNLHKRPTIFFIGNKF